MKAVILAGGLGTRLSEETIHKPKPMVDVGGRPILWHVMKIYSHFGVNEFIICAGYRGYLIKEYFANYFVHTSDVTFDLQANQIEVHKKGAENWKVTVIDTGVNSMTGGRLKRVGDYLDDKPFFFTYGDGVGDGSSVESSDVRRLRRRHADAPWGGQWLQFLGSVDCLDTRRPRDAPPSHPARALSRRRLTAATCLDRVHARRPRSSRPGEYNG